MCFYSLMEGLVCRFIICYFVSKDGLFVFPLCLSNSRCFLNIFYRTVNPLSFRFVEDLKCHECLNCTTFSHVLPMVSNVINLLTWLKNWYIHRVGEVDVGIDNTIDELGYGSSQLKMMWKTIDEEDGDGGRARFCLHFSQPSTFPMWTPSVCL